MSGNRNKLKKVLLVVGMLLSTSYGYGLEKPQVEQFDKLTAQFDLWTHELCNLKGTKSKDTLLAELKAIVDASVSLKQTIPDTPPADILLKTMLQDFTNGLDALYKTLSTATSLMDLNKSGTASCSLQPMLEKAQKDLNILISHVEAHPETYTTEVRDALKRYRDTTFRKFDTFWRPKGWAYFYAALRKYFPYI